ncbi:MarR family transcriptional regulator [Kitasatospora sp. NPDC059088]|uniref:GbsR/MarR family transcriptional regulator n=1 Tax=Kitasatospora sp. NPDC059088 TaxID=3346722 RepID=UPI0036BBB9BA
MPGGRLTGEERRTIAEGLAEGLGYGGIGRRLGRPASTVLREVTRNGGPEDYRADQAQESTRDRARRRRPERPPEPAAPDDGDGRDPRQLREFEEFFTALLERQGLPRMAARVLACLCVADSGAATAAELVGRLRVSPASVSSAVNFLEQQGMVRRERTPGERRERYVMGDDIWLRSALAALRMNEELIAATRRGAEVLGPATPAGARFDASAEFLLLMSEALHLVLERWHGRRGEEWGGGGGGPPPPPPPPTPVILSRTG